MSTMESPLAVRAEAAIRRLREVDGVRVRAEGEELVEIHIVSSSERSPKQIVRDVEAVLRTELDMGIDRRIVSVALARCDDPAARRPAPRPVPARAERAAGTAAFADPPEPPPAARRPAPAPSAARAEDPFATPRASEPPAAPAHEERIRYENANLIVHGQRTQAQVELRWKGLPRIGNASGWSARDDAHRLVASATTLAVQEFLADPVAIGVRDVSFVEAGGKRVAVVVLSLLAHRHEKVLTGCCSVEQDTPQAVVLATLAALNRLVAGLRVKEPTEYVLRAEGIAHEV
jgi:hypothetical protein